jgi:hypothetical protein
MSPKEPLPILRPSLYLFPTRSSIFPDLRHRAAPLLKQLSTVLSCGSQLPAGREQPRARAAAAPPRCGCRLVLLPAGQGACGQAS